MMSYLIKQFGKILHIKKYDDEAYLDEMLMQKKYTQDSDEYEAEGVVVMDRELTNESGSSLHRPTMTASQII